MIKKINSFFNFKDKVHILKITTLIFFESFFEIITLILIPILVLIVQGEVFFLDFISNNSLIKKTNINFLDLSFNDNVNFFITLFLTFVTLRFVFKIWSQKATATLIKVITIEKAKLFLNFFFKARYDLVQKFKISDIQVTTEQFELIGRSIIQTLAILKEFVILLSIFLIILFKSWKVALIIVISFLIAFYFFLHNTRKKISDLSLQTRKLRVKYLSKLIETFSAVKEIYLYKKFQLIIDEVDVALTNIINNKLDTEFYGHTIRPILESIFLVIMSLFVFYYSSVSNNIETNLIPFISFLIICTIRALPSFSVISQNIISIKSILKVTKKTFDIYDFFNALYKVSNNLDLNKSKFENSIQLKNCYYKHNKNFNGFELKNISLTIKKGEKIGIFGGTGSGKSTLLDLIVGLINPQRGSIYIDGKKKNGFSIIDSGFVSQNPFLFNDTLKKNIAFSEKIQKQDIIKIKKIIKICQLDKFTNSKKNNLNYLIRDFGKNLSGGEKQRIAIARALFANQDFLILDEATTGLDKKTELQIFNSIKKIYPNITIILITHEKYNLKNFKKIFVISDGNISRTCNYKNL